jgi:D-beta-D-heptose 7-phosphate kinase/D-beta-D-heptose 1-phosphate adenosyltransferase
MPDSLAAILARFPARRLLVIGDLMLDEFIWGTVSRISPEAPVPVVNVTGESYYPGGAANVARNVREFTPHTALMGLAGADPDGCRLLDLLRASGIDSAGVQQAEGVRTTVKTRIIARNQQVVRVDRERKAGLDEVQRARVMELVEQAIPRADAVIVADYGKGFLSQPLADHIGAVSRRHGVLLAVDPHPHTSLVWPGATAVKPNRTEAFLAAGMGPSATSGDGSAPPPSDPVLLEVGDRLLRQWDCGLLLLTLGEQGMLLFEKDAPPYHAPARAKDVFDVSGAGDTAISVLALALAAGAAPRQAVDLANCASGIAVGKLGTATVSLAELEAAATAL